MRIKNGTLGVLYILLGALLVLLTIGFWLVRLTLLLVGLYLINYGLTMRGMPDFKVMIIRYMTKTKC